MDDGLIIDRIDEKEERVRERGFMCYEMEGSAQTGFVERLDTCVICGREICTHI